jgi:hypothetical protein
VFNPGERVEGMTNLLWTLGCAVGLKLGVPAERWSVNWSIVTYAAAILLLVLRFRGRHRGAAPVPIAALLAAGAPDLWIWASSGLETFPFAFLVLLGTLLLADEPPFGNRAFAAGIVWALAALTRPDGALFAGLGVGWQLALRRPGPASRLLGGFLVVWGPATLGRVAYYGHFLPNTYWAKSADLSWWSQGLRYLQLFAERYGLWLLGPLGVGVALARRRLSPAGAGAFAAVASLVYALWIAKVGGDFMFARMLVPIAPLLLLAVEDAFVTLPGPALLPPVVAAALAAVVLALPAPVRDGRWRFGVADEHWYYRDD